MKILIVTQYFWPENFRINDLVDGLVAKNNQVTILTGKPNYPSGKTFKEFVDKPDLFSIYKSSEVIRVPIIPRGNNKLTLALNYLSFAILGILIGTWKLRKYNFDAIFVYEPSPITVGLPAIWLKTIKKAPVIFWTLDLWPESLTSFNMVKSKSLIFIVGKLVSFIYNRCDLILAQSKSFISPIRKYCKDSINIKYFPSWSEQLPSSNKKAPEVEYDSKVFNILFTGNIGIAQDFPAIIEAADYLKREKVRWLIVGEGRKSVWLKNEVKKRNLESNILLLGAFPIERMTSFYNHSQALLVSLKSDYALSLVIPGKMQSYLMSGLPLLGMVQGEAKQVIESSGCGFTSESGNGQALASIVKKMMKSSEEDRLLMGELGRQYAHKEFNRKTLIDKLESWMNQYSEKYNK